MERYAWCLQGLGQQEKAVPYVQKLIELRPDLTNGYSTLANIYLSINEYALAEPLARKGMELAPEMKWWAYSDYGNILSRTRRFSESEPT
ncbi:MAG: hypothetical protein IPM82_16360 [Saprospiraceae bacterium]|nr:hypothetical protein [Saprospiraceae bacterium]